MLTDDLQPMELCEMSIGRLNPQDTADLWIQACDRKTSFVDIGGVGENSINERATWALRCGYERIAMADLTEPGHSLWTFYRDGLQKAGLENSIELLPNVNVDDADLVKRIGRWDFVYSTGIIYHCPNPIMTIINYGKIASYNLILNTVVVPTKISNIEGEVRIDEGSALFLPSLTGPSRAVLSRYYKDKFGWELNVLAPDPALRATSSLPHMHDDGTPSYNPYWWLFTIQSFETALALTGMKIKERHTWEDHAHFVWLERT